MTVNDDALSFPKRPVIIATTILLLILLALALINEQKRAKQLAELKQKYCSRVITNRETDLLKVFDATILPDEKKTASVMQVFDSTIGLEGALYLVFPFQNSLWSASRWGAGIPNNDGDVLLRPEWGTWDEIIRKNSCEAYRVDENFWLLRNIKSTTQKKSILLLKVRIEG